MFCLLEYELLQSDFVIKCVTYCVTRCLSCFLANSIIAFTFLSRHWIVNTVDGTGDKMNLLHMVTMRVCGCGQCEFCEFLADNFVDLLTARHKFTPKFARS